VGYKITTTENQKIKLPRIVFAPRRRGTCDASKISSVLWQRFSGKAGAEQKASGEFVDLVSCLRLSLSHSVCVGSRLEGVRFPFILVLHPRSISLIRAPYSCALVRLRQRRARSGGGGGGSSSSARPLSARPKELTVMETNERHAAIF
jgi:hypothetical protein